MALCLTLRISFSVGVRVTAYGYRLLPGLVLGLAIMNMGLGRVELEFRLGLGLGIMAMLATNDLCYGVALCLEFRDRF